MFAKLARHKENIRFRKRKNVHLEQGAGLPTVAKVFVLRHKDSNEINGTKWPVTVSVSRLRT